MALIKQYNSDFSPESEVDVDVNAISAKVTKQLIHDACVMYHANRRVGTMRTKSRGEVAGSTAKMYRQKGTGRARAGHRRSPIRRGGGHAFAKRPRDFGYSLPRKALQVATKMSLRLKVEAGDVVVLASLELPELKTRHVASALKRLGLCGRTCLLVTDTVDRGLYRCSRNIPGLTVVPALDLNAELLMRHRVVVLIGAASKLVGG